jgi:hypothetical protein
MPRPLIRLLTLSFSALILNSPAALAKERVIKNYSFDLDGIERVEILGAVGEINVIHTDTQQVSVVLAITQSDKGWFNHDVNLDEVELHSDVQGKRLVLRQTDEDLNIEWTLELPTVAETTIEFGVGEIDGEFGATSLEVELGVGAVDISLPAAAVGAIELSVGVGDASLRGAETEEQRHAMVSQEISGRGRGDRDLEVEVGVGDIDVDLDD